MEARKRKFCVYCKPEDINDATFRYVEVIRQGLREAGGEDLGITWSDATLRQADDVVSISCMPAARVMWKHPGARLIHWFQGIEAVERRFLHGGWRGWGRYVIWSALEYLVLRKARVKLFVSEEMRRFLGDDRLGKGQSLSFPCYNADPLPQAVGPADRYAALNLVYAGSLYKWQRVEDVLATFKLLSQARPDASLTLFTREVERARALCRSMGLERVQVASVSPEELVQALQRFSHGFILREDIAINRVSTPTKLSTYMAAGVIPVLTEATPALSHILEAVPYKVIVREPTDHREIADRLLAMTQAAPSPAQVHEAFASVFSSHFSDAVHARRIAEALAADAR